MTDSAVQNAAAKADGMVHPALLAASMIDERAPISSKPSTTCRWNSRSRFCFSCRPIALSKFSTSRARTRTGTRHAAAARNSRKAACRRVGRPRRRNLPPTQRATLLRTAHSAGRRHQGQHPSTAGIFEGQRGIDDDDGIRQRSLDLHPSSRRSTTFVM